MPRCFTFKLPSLLFLTLLLLVGAWQWLPTLTINIGQRDKRFIQNTHEPEYFTEIEHWIRWTKADSRLEIPNIESFRPLILDLALLNSYPSGTPDPIITLEIAKQRLTKIIVGRQINGIRHYRLLLAPQKQFSWNLPLDLQSTTLLRSADPRPLGVMLVSISLAQTGKSPFLPPPWQMIAFLLISTTSYFALLGIGASRRTSWLLTALIAFFLAISLLFIPLDILPFTMRLAGLISLGTLYGLVVKMVVQKKEGTEWVAGDDLPLLMGFGYWLLPIYQLIMTADGARSVTPYPPTLWVFGGTLLLGTIGLGFLGLRKQLHCWPKLMLGLLALAALGQIAVMMEFTMRRSGPDFWILFKGARDWVRGGSFYNLQAIQENHFGHVFKVPPFYGMLFTPFVQQDGFLILFWHRITNIILFATTFLFFLRCFSLKLLSPIGVGLILLFNFRPATDTIAFGQIDIMLLFLLTLALIANRKGYDELAGATIALGTLFKIYPILMLFFFLAKRQWRVWVGFGAGILLWNGLAVAVVGLEMHRSYLFEVLPRIGGGTAWVENQTLNGFVSRFFASTISSTKFDQPIATALTFGGFGLAISTALCLTRQPTARFEPRYLLQFSLFVLIMILFVPVAWMHYETVTILPFVGLLLFAQTQSLRRWQAALSGLAYALLAYGNQWSFFDGTILGWLTILGLSFKFYGLLALGAVLLALLQKPAEANKLAKLA